MKFLTTAWTTFAANPVVVRDLRAQMRGVKSYWFQGAYLLLLGVLAIAGYAAATGQGTLGGHPVNIVDAQGQLESLYYFIFVTLAVLMCLIAPALTAAAIVGERQRLSFDLLVTTPLRASELLIGKLVSSIAFLGLLLTLSLPASALCVLLGGATMGDVLRVYLQLAIDGIVMAAIGLFFSCTAKTHLLAVVWSYVAVGAFLAATASAAISTGEFGHAVTTPLTFFAALNPLCAVFSQTSVALKIGRVAIPVLLGSAVLAWLIVRILITAAAYRLGTHGADCATSLRKQGLALSALAAYIAAVSVFEYSRQTSTPTAFDGGVAAGVLISCVLAFCALLPVLPALFVPVTGEDEFPGGVREIAQNDSAAYQPRNLLRPIHSGALPYFHALVIVMVAAILAAAVQTWGPSAATTALPMTAIGVLYLFGLGFLLWQIARFSAAAAPGAPGARGLAFGIFALTTALPLMALTFSSSGHAAEQFLDLTFIFIPLGAINWQANSAIWGESWQLATLYATFLCAAMGVAWAGLRRQISKRKQLPVATASA
jgi:ABC-type transport system involved in multi-copper enzyme maturation permease subunit